MTDTQNPQATPDNPSPARPPYFWERIYRALGFGYRIEHIAGTEISLGPITRLTLKDGQWKGPRYLSRRSWRVDVLSVSALLQSLVAANAPMVGGLQAAAREESHRHHSWTPQRVSNTLLFALMGTLVFCSGLQLIVAPSHMNGFTLAIFFLLFAGSLGVSVGLAIRGARRLDTYLTLAQRLDGGASLSAAMASLPKVFPRHLVDLVSLGEETGHVEEAFGQFNEGMINALGLHQRLFSILSYLAGVFFIQSLIIIFLCFKVFPVYAEMYNDIDQVGKDMISLPQIELIHVVSENLKTYGYLWPYFFGILGLLFITAIAIHVRHRGSLATGFFASILFFVPWIRGIVIRQNLGLIAMMLHGLLRGGVTLDRAIAMCTVVDIHPAYQRWLHDLRSALASGESVSDALNQTRRSGIIPESFIGQLEAGTYSGQLPAMLDRIAALYQTECERRMSLLVAGLLPLGILFLGYITLCTQLVGLRIMIGIGDQLIV